MIARVRYRKSFFLSVLAALFAGTTLAIGSEQAITSSASSEPPNQKVEWLGVEVVTDKPTLAQEIRSKIPLPAHSVLDFPGDVRYKQWCEAVRAAYPKAAASCSPILMEGAKGYYVVQVEFAPARPRKDTCDPHAPKLPPQLGAASDHFIELLQASLMRGPSNGAAYREFVNDEGFLDYADADLHKFAVSTHGEVHAHLHEVVASTKVCGAADRSAAVQLMNWSGDTAANIRIGAEGILDQDEGVRNSSTRLIGVFMGKLEDSTSVEPLVRTLCVQLGYTSFSDRDKAVNALLALADQHPLSRKAIRAGCEPLIRQRASDGESISPQIQGSAANLLTLLSGRADGR